jgi:hypothetical protein
VRFLAGDRLEHERVAVDSRPSAHELVALLVAPEADRERSRLEPRQRIREPLQRAQRGLDEELAADQRRDGVPGQAEDERLAAHAERDRLARLHGDPPEDFLHAELLLDRADEIVLADRDAARRDQDVGREPDLQRRAHCVLVVRDRRLGHHLGARRGQRRREHEAVRLVDLPRAERPAGIDELASGGEHNDVRAPHARKLGHAGCGGRGQPRRGEPNAGGNHDLPGGDVAAARADMRARVDRSRDLHSVVNSANVLNRDNSIGGLGNDGTRRDGHSTTGLELPVERPAGSGLTDDPQCSRQIGRAYGEAVHRRARERRQVDTRRHLGRGDAAPSLGDRHALGRQSAHALQDPLLRRIEGE